MKVTANIILGAKPEPYLKHCLDSIIPCVNDTVIVANTHNQNSDLIERYRMVRVIHKPFENFAIARNHALDESADADYILWVDADEVHFTEELKRFINDVTSRNGIAGKAAFYHFVKDIKHYQSIDDRLILLKNRTFRWVKAVDEYPEFPKGTKGDVIDTDYKYHHYGYTKPQRELWEGWMDRAKMLGEKNPWFADKDPDTILDERKLIEYKGLYPEVMQCD